MYHFLNGPFGNEGTNSHASNSFSRMRMFYFLFARVAFWRKHHYDFVGARSSRNLSDAHGNAVFLERLFVCTRKTIKSLKISTRRKVGGRGRWRMGSAKTTIANLRFNGQCITRIINCNIPVLRVVSSFRFTVLSFLLSLSSFYYLLLAHTLALLLWDR